MFNLLFKFLKKRNKNISCRHQIDQGNLQDNLGEQAAGHILIIGKIGKGKTTAATSILKIKDAAAQQIGFRDAFHAEKTRRNLRAFGGYSAQSMYEAEQVDAYSDLAYSWISDFMKISSHVKNPPSATEFIEMALQVRKRKQDEQEKQEIERVLIKYGLTVIEEKEED